MNWEQRFTEKGVLWRMPAPFQSNNHHVATNLSGKHVDAYFNASLFMRDDAALRQVIHDVLIPVLAEDGRKVDRVVSQAPYGIKLAAACAVALDAESGTIWKTGTEVSADYEPKEDERVLVVGDENYSGNSLRQTLDFTKATGSATLPFVFTLANLSQARSIGGNDIVAAAHVETRQFDPDDCLLCALGSTAVRPQTHWDTLLEQTGYAS